MVMVEMPSPGKGIVEGLKLTVVPVGMPEADKLTVPLKPLPRTTKMLETPCWPWATVRVEGTAETVKLPFPVGAMFLSVMVMTDVPDPGAPMELGLNVTDTPRGCPEAERLMELLNPPLI